MTTREHVTARFAEIGALTEGWFDGAGASFQGRDFSYAEKFIHRLMETGVPAPGVFPMPDGAVSAEWFFPDPKGGADIVFIAEGTYAEISFFEIGDNGEGPVQGFHLADDENLAFLFFREHWRV